LNRSPGCCGHRNPSQTQVNSNREPMPKYLQLLLKRVLDILASGALLLLLSPLFLILAVLVKLFSPGSVFFPWHVIGQGGRPFVGYKFRTMVVGADRMRESLQAENEMTGPFFKMTRDPRVTPVGRIMRRFSLDELPQLWSILIGDMSLVGPRPTQVFEYEKLDEWQKRRVEVRPGAVSSWILTGKTHNFDEMVRLDLDYIDRWSIWTDLRMLLKTIPYVLLGKNC
jgi:lipopolysaccharide/colanic/teichoic acid biosynthesis glycosyltransferase